jgi:hypothetical protein
LRVSAWLHDCGKLSTPDSVLDKATKLHLMQDGIETINVRFAALRQQKRADFMKARQFSDSAARDLLQTILDGEIGTTLEADRLFIAIPPTKAANSWRRQGTSARTQSLHWNGWMQNGKSQPC